MSQLISATDESERIYPYNYNRWTPKGNSPRKAKSHSNKLHGQIEDYFKDNGKVKNKGFKRFLNKHNYLEEIEIEKRYQNNTYTGIIDALFKDKYNQIILVDWKS